MTFKDIQWAAVFSGLALVEAALLYKLIAGQAAASATEMITAICVVGILLVLSPNADRMESLSFTKKGFTIELEKLKMKTSENSDAVVGLILGSMGDDAYKQLKKFYRPEGYGGYQKKHHQGLETELYHLRNLGYIHFKEYCRLPDGTKVESIYDIPPEGPQLSDYFDTTATGRNYIRLREKHDLTATA